MWQYQIQLLADLNLKKTPQLVELVDDSKVLMFFLPISFSILFSSKLYFIYHESLFPLQDVEELLGLAPEKILLKWMNFHLKKAGYKKTVNNFSSDLKVILPQFPTLISVLISLGKLSPNL